MTDYAAPISSGPLLFLILACGTLLILASVRGFAPARNRNNISATDVLMFLWTAIFALYYIGFRSFDAGFDTPRYVNAYAALGRIVDAMAVGNRIYGNSEWLFWPMQALIKYCGADARSWLLTVTLINLTIVVIVYLCISRELGLPSGICAYVYLTYIVVYYGNIMRQALSMPLAVIAWYQWNQKRRLFALLLFATSVGLHWASLAILGVVVIEKILPRRRATLIVLFAGAILAAPLVRLVVDRWANSSAVLAEKALLYSTHDSHFGNVLATANFAICVLSVSLFVAFYDCFKEYRTFSSIFTLYACLVFSGILVGDLAERHFASIALLSPALVSKIVAETMRRRGTLEFERVGASFVAMIFVTLGCLVLTRASAVFTLGL